RENLDGGCGHVDWRGPPWHWHHHVAGDPDSTGGPHAGRHRGWGDRIWRHADRDRRRHERRAASSTPAGPPTEDELLRRARARAARETGFYVHFTAYLGTLARPAVT